MFCDTPVGKDTTGNFTLSYKGVAVRTDCNRFITFRRERERIAVEKGREKGTVERGPVKFGPVKLYDVTGLTLPGCDALIYRVPVTEANLKTGDLVLMSDCPLQVLYLTKDPDGGSLTGITASGETITYTAPLRLGDCARFIRIMSVLDTCGLDSHEITEDHIALIAAILCCQPRGGGFGLDMMASTIADNLLTLGDPEEGLDPAIVLQRQRHFRGQLPLMLALQQSQCLESYILTRALQHSY
jgi:hypothetical protein